jgi:hypothetical protein
METKLKNKGQAQLAMAIATTAIVLIVVVIVIGVLTANLSVGLTGAALAAYNNVNSHLIFLTGSGTNYVWIGLTLVAVGIIILAGMGYLRGIFDSVKVHLTGEHDDDPQVILLVAYYGN